MDRFENILEQQHREAMKKVLQTPEGSAFVGVLRVMFNTGLLPEECLDPMNVEVELGRYAMRHCPQLLQHLKRKKDE